VKFEIKAKAMHPAAAGIKRIIVGADLRVCPVFIHWLLRLLWL